MSTTLTQKRPSGIRTVADKEGKKTPRLVVGIGSSPLATHLAAHFRNTGWEVALTGSGEDARRLAVRNRANVLVLPVSTGNLLTTAKLVTALPKRTKVVLVGPGENDELKQASAFLGAARFVAETGGLGPLVEAVARICGN